MNPKRKRNKQLKFLRAYSNAERFIKGNRQGKRTFKSCTNYLVQEQNAQREINIALQANYAELEVRAICHALKDGTFPDVESPTARIPIPIHHKIGADFILKHQKIPTVKIFNGGGYYSATCPKCGKIKILSSELNTLSAVCNKCYTAFKLEK